LEAVQGAQTGAGSFLANHRLKRRRQPLSVRSNAYGIRTNGLAQHRRRSAPPKPPLQAGFTRVAIKFELHHRHSQSLSPDRYPSFLRKLLSSQFGPAAGKRREHTGLHGGLRPHPIRAPGSRHGTGSGGGPAPQHCGGRAAAACPQIGVSAPARMYSLATSCRFVQRRVDSATIRCRSVQSDQSPVRAKAHACICTVRLRVQLWPAHVTR
jgi:hypothetical protein